MNQKKMRLLVLIDRYLPILGGAQNNVHELSRGLVKKGMTVTVLTRLVVPGLKKKELVNNILVKRFAAFPIRVISKLLFAFSMIGYLFWIRKDYDYILCVPCAMYSELFPPFIASFFTGKPYIVRLTSVSNFEYMLSWRIRSLQEFLQRLFCPPFFWRWVLDKASNIVVMNQVLYEEAKQYGLKKLKIISSGADTNRFYPATDKEKMELRKKLHLSEEKLIALSIGRYERGKNHLTLIKAVEKIEKEYAPGMLFTIIIGAVEANQIDSNELGLKNYVIEKGLQHFITFRDDISNIEDYLRGSDIFVFPSLMQEGMSRVVMEAMLCGLPIISCDQPQVICTFPDKVGIFFPGTNRDILVKHLISLMESNEQRDSYGQRLALFSQKEYTLDRVVNSYNALFDKITSR